MPPVRNASDPPASSSRPQSSPPLRKKTSSLQNPDSKRKKRSATTTRSPFHLSRLCASKLINTVKPYHLITDKNYWFKNWKAIPSSLCYQLIASNWRRALRRFPSKKLTWNSSLFPTQYVIIPVFPTLITPYHSPSSSSSSSVLKCRRVPCASDIQHLDARPPPHLYSLITLSVPPSFITNPYIFRNFSIFVYI